MVPAAARLSSIVTNQQGFQHTVDGWTEFGAEYGIDRHLPRLVNAQFTELITCKKTFTLEWRRSVCAHFGLLPGVI